MDLPSQLLAKSFFAFPVSWDLVLKLVGKTHQIEYGRRFLIFRLIDSTLRNWPS